MAATTGPRLTKERKANDFAFPVAANVTCNSGAIAAFTGTATNIGPAITGTTQRVVGVFDETVTNGATAGAVTVKVRRGCFQFANSAGADEITRAHIGASAFIVDDQTVAATNGSSTRSAGGVIRDVDAGGVWVEF